MEGFAGLEGVFCDYQRSKFAVLPVELERSTTYIKGTEHGPQAIITASKYLELYDEALDINPAENGITTLEPIANEPDAHKAIANIESASSKVFNDDKILVLLGGEHTVSIGSARAAKKRWADLTVIHFDAHADLRQSYNGDPLNHACVSARISEFAEMVHIGIRSLSDDETDEVKKRKAEKKLFFAKDILEGGRLKDILKNLRDNVYISFDLDVLDPSIMASVGTPEPGGLGWYQTLDILEVIAREKNIVGFDLVELCPNQASRPYDFTAAKLAYKIMGYIARQ